MSLADEHALNASCAVVYSTSALLFWTAESLSRLANAYIDSSGEVSLPLTRHKYCRMYGRVSRPYLATEMARWLCHRYLQCLNPFDHSNAHDKSELTCLANAMGGSSTDFFCAGEHAESSRSAEEVCKSIYSSKSRFYIRYPSHCVSTTHKYC